MKRITLVLSFIVASLFATAQAPQLINYQAIARSSAGTPLADSNLTIIFSIHQTTAGGTIIYSESQSLKTNAFGLFTTTIGSGTPSTGTFSGINWAAGPYFLETFVNAASMGTTQLVSVPYALYAQYAANGPTGNPGPTGSVGPTGPMGNPGPTGAASSVAGPTGPMGPTGATGIGLAGPTGPMGNPGPTGPLGNPGPTGLTGNPGPTGSAGSVGPTGPMGNPGPTGLTGNPGPTGSAGSVGPTGLAGATGVTGTTGVTGATGATGFLPPGFTNGATPHWKGGKWFIDTTIYNNGGHVAIGNVSPDPSSILDLSYSPGQLGFLAPKTALKATNDNTTIINPATGLIIYNTATGGSFPTNVVPGYYYNAGTAGSPNWVLFMAGNGSTSGTAWSITGNAGTNPGTNYIGTSDAQPLEFATSGIDRMMLDVNGTLNISQGNNSNSAANFGITNNTDPANALAVTTTGTGNAIFAFQNGTGGDAGYFNLNSSSNANNAIYGISSGSGYTISTLNNGTTGGAGLFQINSATNNQAAVNALSNGGGAALYAQQTGTGTALQATNTSNTHATIFAQNSGTYDVADFVNGTSASTGTVLSVIQNSTSNAYGGTFSITNAANTSNAIYATTPGTGAAILANSTGNNGVGVSATVSGTTSIAIEGQSNGTSGSAGYFSVNNAGNGNNAVQAQSIGGGPTVWATNNGTGNAGQFEIPPSSSNSNTALYGITYGTGVAVQAQIVNGSNSNAALSATTNGTGNAGYFNTSNTSNTAPTLNVSNSSTNANSYTASFSNVSGSTAPEVYISNSGTGNGLNVVHSGTAGYAGLFQIGVGSNASTSLYGVTYGTGIGVEAQINNVSNTNTALYVTTNGTGNGIVAITGNSSQTVFAENNGIGSVAEFVNTSAAATSPLLLVNANTTGKALQIIDGNQATNKVLTSIDATGDATWQNLPGVGTGFSASASVPTTCPSGVQTTITFGTTTSPDYNDAGANYNGSVYTAPTAGVYQFNASVGFTGAPISGAYRIGIVTSTSGTTKTVTIPATTSGTMSIPISASLRLTAGETVQIVILQTTGSSLNCQTGTLSTWFNGYRIY